ncbi:flagellar biosynthesis regulator FlaF [Teichococcus deserti]|uniref:flagellar biosynthesis regulator FlaF n=1 Tax=Teichococcus deserti TaxID=1817963 RepID=UPI0009FA0E07|nr:flagellar biosynthesis regulator FlaF [Pseudoroseomonas deserti]
MITVPFASAAAFAPIAAALPLQHGRAGEAAAFQKAVGALVAAQEDKALRAGALTLNRRLWQAVMVAIADPDSSLPVALRQGLATLGVAVLREQDRHSPDLSFLIAIDRQIMAGLTAWH